MWFSKKEILPYLFKKDPKYQIKKISLKETEYCRLRQHFRKAKIGILEKVTNYLCQ